MRQKYLNLSSSSDVHRLAEALWAERSPFRKGPSGCADPHALIHELGVQRFELELKNGDLSAAYNEIWSILERYTELYDFAPVAYFTFLTNGRIGEANFAAATLLGLERSKVIGASIFDFVAEKDLQAFQLFLLEIGKTPSPCKQGEFEIRRTDGTCLHVRLNGVCGDFVPNQGRNVKIAMIDLTEREQSRRLLQAERDLALNCFDTASVFMAVLDPAGMILRVNRKGLELLQRDHESDLIGRNWFTECLPGRVSRRSRELFLTVISGEKGDQRQHRNRILCRDGSTRHLAFRDSLLRDSHAEIVGVVCVGVELGQEESRPTRGRKD
jgi:PAS domain S-box-containing protein